MQQCGCGKCGGEITGLAHIGVMTADIKAAVAFYRDILGFEVTDEASLSNGVAIAFLDNKGCLIELVQPAVPTDVNNIPKAGIVDHIAMEVTGIEQLVCRLIDKGVQFKGEVATMPDLVGGIKNIFFDGPDGVKLEFFEYIK